MVNSSTILYRLIKYSTQEDYFHIPKFCSGNYKQFRVTYLSRVGKSLIPVNKVLNYERKSEGEFSSLLLRAPPLCDRASHGHQRECPRFQPAASFSAFQTEFVCAVGKHTAGNFVERKKVEQRIVRFVFAHTSSFNEGAQKGIWSRSFMYYANLAHGTSLRRWRNRGSLYVHSAAFSFSFRERF
jgi:hypothetical protein